MKKYIFLLVLCISSILVYAQSPIPYLKNNGKYIYVDSISQSPSFANDMQFDEAYPFYNGIAKVGKYFSTGIKYGLVNPNGKFVLPMEYDLVDDFYENLAFVGKGEVHLKFNYLIDGIGGYVSRDGSFSIPLTKYYSKSDGFSEGLAWVTYNKDDDSKYGLVNKLGEIVVDFKYSSANQFSEGMSAVQASNFKWGFVNNKGDEIIPCIYDYVGDFKYGLAPVRIKNKAGYIDKNGKIHIPLKFEFAQNFSESLAAVTLNKKIAFINTNGEIKIPFKWDYSTYNGFKNGVVSVGMYSGKQGFINTSGRIVVPIKYDGAENIAFNRIRVSKGDAVGQIFDGSYGIVDYSGNEVLPIIYESIEYLYGNLFKVSQKGKGFIIDLATKQNYTDFQMPSSVTIDNSKSNDCPPNFKRISTNDVTGTARRYKAVDGHFYYEVKLAVKPKNPTSSYVTKIEATRLRQGYDRAYGDEVRKEGYYVNASSGNFKFIGCTEKDVFVIEGSYKCDDGGMRGYSATVYFRDLTIIK